MKKIIKLRRKILSLTLILCMTLALMPVMTLPVAAAVGTTALNLTAQATDTSNAGEGWAWYVGGVTVDTVFYAGKVLVLSGR